MITIRTGDPDEGAQLREIALQAKRHWGHDQAALARWIAMGDFSPALFHEKRVLVAEAAGDAVAWSSVITAARAGDVAWLDDLWVRPAWMRQGIGTRLFHDSAALARRDGATRMEWEAEPMALGFYERMGGRIVRHTPPDPVWHRTLPVMAVDLD